jgi:hypothetical protein
VWMLPRRVAAWVRPSCSLRCARRGPSYLCSPGRELRRRYGEPGCAQVRVPVAMGRNERKWSGLSCELLGSVGNQPSPAD